MSNPSTCLAKCRWILYKENSALTVKQIHTKYEEKFGSISIDYLSNVLFLDAVGPRPKVKKEQAVGLPEFHIYKLAANHS